MPGLNPRMLRTLHRNVAANRAARAAAVEEEARAAALMSESRRLAFDLAAAGRLEEAERERERAERAARGRDRARARIREADRSWRDLVGALAEFDPCDASGEVPLVLLPVRVETIYSRPQHLEGEGRVPGDRLLIRIFPDDIHIDQLEPGLDEAEAAAAEEYWRKVWDEPEGASGREDAWRQLVDGLGPSRASYAAWAKTPSETDGNVVFPQLPPRSRRAALARLLPDRFVAIATVPTALADVQLTAVGNQIDPEVVTGLLDGDEERPRGQAGTLSVPPGAEWLTSFSIAKDKGLALELPLPAPKVRIDRLLVFGVRSSFDPKQSAAELETLLRSHRLSRGLSFAPQGTCTNNTETNRAAWRGAPDLPPPARHAPEAGSNAAVLAAALGVSPLLFAGLAGAGRSEQADMRAVNVALWNATWGPFLDRVGKVDKKVTLTDGGREAIRGFFLDSVRGGGPLPTIQVGAQPYGVLPVACLAEDIWRSRDRLDARLLEYLRPLREHWETLSKSLATVTGGQPIDEAMEEILGTSAISLGYRVRTVLSNAASDLFIQLSEDDQAPDLAQQLIQRMVFEHFARLSFTGLASHGALAKKSRPLPLPLVHDTDMAFIDHLLAGSSGTPEIQSIFQALLQFARENIDQEQKDSGDLPDYIKAVEYATTLTSEIRAQALAVASTERRAPSSELHMFADQVMALTGSTGPMRLAELQPAASTRTSFSGLALESSSAEARGELAAAAVATWARWSAHSNEFLEALEHLKGAGLTLKELEILVAETLDLASHRLDGWLTGVVERRRAAMRARTPEGVQVGAFAWLENIAPQDQEASAGGYIHAPTLNHATTAGLLRNAYLSHRRSATGSNPFEIDLTSRRVRTALDVLDGIREGHPLAALIGYQIEREIGERSRREAELAAMPRLILSLRDIAPLTARQLTDRAAPAGTAPGEAVAATGVVDGVRLSELWQSSKTDVMTALSAGPKNNPYVAPGTWKGPTAAEEAALGEVIDKAADSIDAAADILLAESVHQLAQGNIPASAASLDAASTGEAFPTSIDFVRTPVKGLTFTHRLLVSLPPANEAGDLGWNAARPRALAEPALERWVARRLGPAHRIVLFADGERRFTMADAGIAALDFVYDSDRTDENGRFDRLEQRIRFSIPDMPADTSFANEQGDGWLADDQPFARMAAFAGTLRSVIVAARPARPADLVRAGETAARSYLGTELADMRTRLEAATEVLRTTGGLLQTLVDQFKAGRADAVQLRAMLEKLAAYGVVVPIVEEELLESVARLAGGEALRRADEAATLWKSGSDTAEQAQMVGRVIFGEGFHVVPSIGPAQDGLAVSLAMPRPKPLPKAPQIRRFLRDIGAVRQAVNEYSGCLLAGDAVGRPVEHFVAQLGPPPPFGPDEWVGGVLDTKKFAPGGSVADLVFEGNRQNSQSSIQALVIDEWIDTVAPGAGSRDEVGNDSQPKRASGLAINAPAASAAPPQAILLALSPDGGRWTTEKLARTLEDTLSLAKLRAVTLEKTGGTAAVLPAIYALSAALQGSIFDVTALTEVADFSAVLKYTKEPGQ
ncbi:hypothetical protein [Ensifer aridi]|uniref:hypothetical protein n=1 Tax=Ensifer aridi TaxID=1708715 RepID=UPI000A10E70E|nr:hypothetical protein [Ensifer aridi]